MANSASYGVYAELNPQPTRTGAPEAVEVYGLDGMFPTTTAAPEDPGEFCFPPFAALTTAGARLMLALLECGVRELGGEIAFGDTDSAAIVATEGGGLVPCSGGADVLPDGQAAVRALSWGQVQALSARFRELSPYNRDYVPGSILKIEDVNFVPGTETSRQLFAFAISAKRYALFVRGVDGAIEVENAKEHGLGHLLWPTRGTRTEAEEVEDRKKGRQWIRDVWKALIRESEGEEFLLPQWADRPALARVTVSTVGILLTFDNLNDEKSYDDSVKPMNFLLSPTVARFGHPAGANPERFHLLGSYETDPDRWLDMTWYEKYSGQTYRIGVGRETPGDRVQVRSYRDVILEYRVHPEAKSLDANGELCAQATCGLLQRRPVELGELVYVGKESNALEQVQQGLIHATADVRTTYQVSDKTLWDLVFLPAIRRIPLQQLAKATGRGIRLIRFWRKGERQPSLEMLALLKLIAARWAAWAMKQPRMSPEDREVALRVLAAAPTAPRRAAKPPAHPKKVRRKSAR